LLDFHQEHGNTAPGRAKTLIPTLGEVLPTERRTDNKLAKLAHVSHGTLDKVKVIVEKATPEQKAELFTELRAYIFHNEHCQHKAYKGYQRNHCDSQYVEPGPQGIGYWIINQSTGNDTA